MQFMNISTVLISGFANTNNCVAHLFVNNYKQGTDQKMHIFPHFDLWQLDYYFSHAVFFAVSDHTSEFVYPTFGEYGKNERNNKKDTSKIVKHFTHCLALCLKWFDNNKHLMEDQHLDMPSKLTNGICSHSGKKYAVRQMGRELNPVYVIFRAGWAVRNAHTIFDYLVKDVVHDVKAAKICAGWTTIGSSGDVWGGQNCSIDDLTVDRHLFVPFCKALFVYQLQK